MMKKIAVIAGIGLMSISALQAQQDSTVNRTVVVENQYNPIIMDASKINVMPKVEDPSVPKTNIDYAVSLRPVTVWNYRSMTLIQREMQSDAFYRGIVRAGYGNNGNVDARAAYLWNMSRKDRLNMAVSLDGWNGDLEVKDMKWSSRFYRAQAGFDYKHAFKKMDLMAGGHYASQVFNYWGEPENIGDKQHQTLIDGYVGVASTAKDMFVQFKAEAGINSFNEKYPLADLREKSKETSVYMKTDVWRPYRNDGYYGLKANVERYSYSSGVMKDWTAFELNPYFIMKDDVWNVRAGAHLDWIGGDDGKLYVAPDISVEFLMGDSYVLFAKTEGGRQTSGLYQMAKIAPYFSDTYVRPTYVTLDASMGLKASPANGWWFLVNGGYQLRKNDICWALEQKSPFWYASNISGDTKVFYGTAELKYDYKDCFDVTFKGTYYNWNWKNVNQMEENSDLLALSLKPELELQVEAGFKIMQNLRMNAGYGYVKRCNDVGGDPVNNLYMGADYSLMESLGVFVRINNLLNKEYVEANACPAQKMNVIMGISFHF